MNDQFHSVVAVQETEKSKSGLKPFTGNGSPVLRVPGLKKLRRIFVGDQELPLSITEPQVVDSAGTTEDVNVEMVQLAKDAEGEILLRNKKSNDGIWQDGQKFYIDGDFAAAKQSEDTETPKATKAPEAPATSEVAAAK